MLLLLPALLAVQTTPLDAFRGKHRGDPRPQPRRVPFALPPHPRAGTRRPMGFVRLDSFAPASARRGPTPWSRRISASCP